LLGGEHRRRGHLEVLFVFDRRHGVTGCGLLLAVTLPSGIVVKWMFRRGMW
jgi:hypothetical protein